jgi:DNA uptake protein ComE-like DNA-binding protein
MQSFKSQIKTFFNFNKRQERGAFVLIVFIIIAFTVNLLLPFIHKEEAYDFSSTLAEIEAWKKTAVEKESENSTKIDYVKKEKLEVITLNPVSFNPNKYPEEKWLEMGMPNRVVKTILNYEAKGGSFKKADDLQKIYGLKPEIYVQLKDYIVIPEAELTKKKKEWSTVILTEKTKVIVRLDINRADSIEFLKVPGIGPFYAGQIVEYRNRLGGYLSIKQLNGLYKMDSTRLHQWLPYLLRKDTLITQIDINTADFRTVLKHPYIDYETTKKILNYRNKLGRYAGLYQLKSDSIISDSLFQKLEPYLKVD